MPLYGYHCRKCDKDSELLISGDEKPVCPACGSRRLDRLVSRVAPEPKSRGLVKSARALAARQGHFSNFGKG